jgi:hypothetical protein
MKQISAIIIAKIFFLLLVAYLAQLIIPYSDSFPYRGILDNVDASSLLKSFANFDGVQYIIIASQRYFTYNQAYFPAYPMLMRFLHYVFNIEYFYGGLLISNIGFAVGLHYFYKLLRIDFDKKKSLIAVLFLILFPTSFYFHVIYTEGLFFGLFVSFLYFLRKGELKKALFISIFLSATRLIGAFSVVFLLPVILNPSWRVKDPLMSGSPRRGFFATLRMTNKYFSALLLTPLLLLPFLGLASYMLYLWQTTGDPLFFFNSQSAFGANRSTHIILLPQVYYRYFKIFFTATFNWQYLIAALEFISFTFVAGVLSLDLYNICHSGVLSLSKGDRISVFTKIKDAISRTMASFQHDKKILFRLSLNLFSWINILLPTLTGTFSSVPRYALFAISIFYFLANMKNKFAQYLLLVFFAILQIILFAFFIRGYFIA